MMLRAFLTLASIVPAFVVAQTPDMTPIPRDLYAAFQTRYAGMGMGNVQPEFIVGKLPTNDIDSLVPKGAIVLGGVVVRWPSGASMTSSAALLMSATAPEAQTQAIDHLLSRGFRRAPYPGETNEGFAPSPGAFPPFHWYCGDSTSVNVTSQPRSEGGAYVILQLDRIRGDGGMCSPRNRMFAMSRPSRPTHLSFPVLLPPKGASGRQTGETGWSSDGKTRAIIAQLETDLSVEQVVEHYTRELIKGGWKPTKRIRENNVVIQLLRDERGTSPRELVLSDVQLSDKSHQVVAQLYALSPRSP